MFTIHIEVDADFDQVTPPVLDKEEMAENMEPGFAGVVTGVDEDDVTAYIETDTDPDGSE